MERLKASLTSKSTPLLATTTERLVESESAKRNLVCMSRASAAKPFESFMGVTFNATPPTLIENSPGRVLGVNTTSLMDRPKASWTSKSMPLLATLTERLLVKSASRNLLCKSWASLLKPCVSSKALMVIGTPPTLIENSLNAG